MKKQPQGFTLLELLIVIAIIGILVAVLLPNILNARIKATDTAAKAITREVMNSMVGIEAGATNAAGVSVTACNLSAKVVSFTTDAGASNVSVNAPFPATAVSCTNTATTYSVALTYTGGSNATYTRTERR